MKQLFAICLSLLGSLSVSSTFAQGSACTSSVIGTWRVDNAGSSTPYLRISPQSGCNFKATIGGAAATGSIANGKTVTIVETASKVTYTGELQADGSIRGTSSTTPNSLG